MRKLSAFLFILAIGFAGSGCDSNDSDDDSSMSVTERLTGNWNLTGVTDADGDQMATFATGFNSVVVSFTQAGTFTIAIDSKIEGGDDLISGNYSVIESTNTLTLTAEVAGQAVPLTFSYAFENNFTQATFSALGATSVLMNALLDTTLTGTIALILTKV